MEWRALTMNVASSEGLIASTSFACSVARAWSTSRWRSECQSPKLSLTYDVVGLAGGPVDELREGVDDLLDVLDEALGVLEVVRLDHVDDDQGGLGHADAAVPGPPFPRLVASGRMPRPCLSTP